MARADGAGFLSGDLAPAEALVMTEEERQASTKPPSSGGRIVLKRCSGGFGTRRCSRSWTYEEWLMTKRRPWRLGDELLEVTECPSCGSTVGVELEGSGE